MRMQGQYYFCEILHSVLQDDDQPRSQGRRQTYRRQEAQLFLLLGILLFFKRLKARHAASTEGDLRLGGQVGVCRRQEDRSY